MAFYAILTSSISGVFGLLGSFYWDTPTGPSIVVAAISLFLIISVLAQKWR
jgi:zinc transport system permease protein